MKGSELETRRDPGRNWARNLDCHQGILVFSPLITRVLVKETPASRSLAHNLMGFPKTGIQGGSGSGVWLTSWAELCSQEAWGAQVYWRIQGLQSPLAERAIIPSSASGSTGKSPLGPSSYSPSHGFTFVLSNRSDLLPASMAVFKVHLWGTQTDYSDKPGHGAVCVPGTSRDPGWGLGTRAAARFYLCLQNEAALGLLPPVAWPGRQPGSE